MNERSITVGKRLDGQARRSSRWCLPLPLVCLMLLALTVMPSRAQSRGAEANAAPQAQVGTAFTYQGYLTDGGNPANGQYDFRFRLFDVLTGGSAIGTVTVGDQQVTNGLFTVQLDFGPDMFKGEARYLAIGVRPWDSTGAYALLSPRQPLTPAPYALALPGLWTQQNDTCPNVIGGYIDNAVSPGVYGATIGGGKANQVTQNYGTVGGGYGNIANSWRTTISGGLNNTADTDGSTVGGGYDNTADGYYATVGGGESNTTNGNRATIGGGRSNTSGHYATVGGGDDNSASGNDATVGGGYSNAAGGSYATVPGGYDNTATGNYSFAAGRQARANNQGCFVWGDSTDADITCSYNNRWVARASGGVYFYTNSTGTTGVHVNASGGTWSSVSDRNAKENVASVNSTDVLEAVAAMPVSTWNYIGEQAGVRHMGPMAQDFYAAFGLGDSERHITTIDADGVALAAIQGLYSQNQALQKEVSAYEAEVSSYKEENAELEARVDDLEARLAALEQGAVSPPPATGMPAWSLLSGLVAVAVLVVVTRYRGGPLLRKGGRR